MLLRDQQGIAQIYPASLALSLRNEWRFKKFLEVLPSPISDSDILELGPGVGEFTDRLLAHTPKSLTLVEPSVEFVKQLKKKYESHSITIHQEFWPTERAKSERFDVVFGNGILHHFPRQDHSAFVALRKVLKPGGIMCFWEPNIFNPLVAGIFKISILRKAIGLEPQEMAINPPQICRWLVKEMGFSSAKVMACDFMLPILPTALAPSFAKLAQFANEVDRVPIAPAVMIVARIS